MNDGGVPVDLTLQVATEPAAAVPSEGDFSGWVGKALSMAEGEFPAGPCVTIRIVGADESRELNDRYRGKSNPTNVLAFPAGDAAAMVPAGEGTELGDLVMCLEVVSGEAAEQNKQLVAHFAHLAIHGTLHLLGYEHQDDAQAEVMEALERRILGALGFDDPYEFIED